MATATDAILVPPGSIASQVRRADHLARAATSSGAAMWKQTPLDSHNLRFFGKAPGLLSRSHRSRALRLSNSPADCTPHHLPWFRVPVRGLNSRSNRRMTPSRLILTRTKPRCSGSANRRDSASARGCDLPCDDAASMPNIPSRRCRRRKPVARRPRRSSLGNALKRSLCEPISSTLMFQRLIRPIRTKRASRKCDLVVAIERLINKRCFCRVPPGPSEIGVKAAIEAPR